MSSLGLRERKLPIAEIVYPYTFGMAAAEESVYRFLHAVAIIGTHDSGDEFSSAESNERVG